MSRHLTSLAAGRVRTAGRRPAKIAARSVRGPAAPRHRLAMLAALLMGAAQSGAQIFFTTPNPQFIAPASRGTAGAEFSRWDVFYSPYGDPLDPAAGLNFPDLAAPHGTRTLASVAGFTPPANSDPLDPVAFWHLDNPTLRQTATPSAFLIGAGSAGNIYSFAEVTAYEIADTAPAPLGSVVVQWHADGQLIDFSTLKLVAGGNEYAPTNFVTEFKAGVSGFGGVTNRAAAQWNLTGLGITSYTITFQSESSSTSFQEALLDTAPTYVEAVPSDRAWVAASGSWSVAGNWSPGSLPPTGGNVSIAGGTSLTVDGGVREIGELRLTAPGGFTLAAGGGTLKLNTGILATPATATSYVVDAPVTLGAYNVTHLNAQSDLTFHAPVSGSVGFYLSGAGRMKLSAANPFTGPVTVDVGTLEVAGTKSGPGVTTVYEDGTLTGSGTIAGALTMHGTHAPGAAIGTLTHTGAIQYRETAHLSWQLGANATAAGAFDQVAAAGVTVLAGALIDLQLDAPGSTVDLRDSFWRSPRSWPVLTSTSLTGAFALGAVGDDGIGNKPANYGVFSLAHAASGVTLQWTPLPAWESWRRVSFGAQWNDAAVAGELVDAEHDGAENVVEYAFGTDGAVTSAAPRSVRAGNRLALSFTRNAAADDVTITVRGADSLGGPWTDLAQSSADGPMAALVGGVTVTESNSGPVRTVEVRDLYLVTDPAHPRRFLKIHVQRLIHDS